MKKFDKSKRSNFDYWFWHWLSYNLIAKKLDVWKFKYLFHDWYKPWLRLFMSYEKLQKIHRKHANHHIEWLEYKFKKCRNNLYKTGYRYIDKYDYEGTIIDWECSRYTKNDKTLDAYGKYKDLFQRETFKVKYPELYHHGCFIILQSKFFSVLEKLGLSDEWNKNS